jgi:hypothetical protein
MSYPNLSFQQPGQTQGNVYYTSSQQGLTHGFYLRSQISKPFGQPLSPVLPVGETVGWLECDLYCGDATFGAPGQGSGGPALSGPILHSEPWAQEIPPSPIQPSGPSFDFVVRPNLSIGAVPRNFYGPTIGVVPVPQGTVTNGAISQYNNPSGELQKPNKVWTVSIGGNGDSYINLPGVPPGTAFGTPTVGLTPGYIGGGSPGGDPYYYPNPGVNLVLNGVSGPSGKFGGKTYINGEIMNSNYTAASGFPLKINTHASDLILAPDNGGSVVIEPARTSVFSGNIIINPVSSNPGTQSAGAVQMFLGGDPLGSGAPGGGLGYIRCEKASAPAGGATGPTNICNANHNGYIGTLALLPGDGSGLRGYSCIVTSFTSAAKLYIAKNQSQSIGEQGYTCCSSVEAPQGVIIMRGRVRLAANEAAIDLDSAQVPLGELVVPHTNPNLPFPLGTVNAMYQNFTVSVSNAGILPGGGTYPNLDFDPSVPPGHVLGIVKIDPVANQVSLNIRNTGPTPDIFVDWVVYCERKDAGYTNSDYVSTYNNPISGAYETWGTPAYNPAAPPAPPTGVNLDLLYGTNNYEFA